MGTACCTAANGEGAEAYPPSQRPPADDAECAPSAADWPEAEGDEEEEVEGDDDAGKAAARTAAALPPRRLRPTILLKKSAEEHFCVLLVPCFKQVQHNITWPVRLLKAMTSSDCWRAMTSSD